MVSTMKHTTLHQDRTAPGGLGGSASEGRGVLSTASSVAATCVVVTASAEEGMRREGRSARAHACRHTHLSFPAVTRCPDASGTQHIHTHTHTHTTRAGSAELPPRMTQTTHGPQATCR